MTDFSRFTDRARRCLHDAAEIAADRGDGYVGTEHLLLAVVRGGGIGSQLFRKWARANGAEYGDSGNYAIVMSDLDAMYPRRDPYALIAEGLAGRPENTVKFNVISPAASLFGTGGTYTAT